LQTGCRLGTASCTAISCRLLRASIASSLEVGRVSTADVFTALPRLHRSTTADIAFSGVEKLNYHVVE